MNYVGQYIKELRQKKGLTQSELGNLVGVQKSAISKWERGDTQNLKRTTMITLAKIFDVPAVSFIQDDTSINLSPNEIKLLRVFSELNIEGQEKVISYTTDLVDSGKYKKYSESELADEA